MNKSPREIGSANQSWLWLAGFRLRVVANQVRRGLREVIRPTSFAKHGKPEEFPFLLHESRTKLWATTDQGETLLEAGKVQNLRRACKAFDKVALSKGEVFSFWRLLGRTTRQKGFVRGRQIEGGCVVPALGGGICQISSAIYDLALKAGLEIIERHPHTARVATLQSTEARDATVAWNHIDLRFTSATPIMLRCELTAEELVVAIWAKEPKPVAAFRERGALLQLKLARSCEECGETDCRRHAQRPAETGLKKAWLLDTVWPEFAEYLGASDSGGDQILVPTRLIRQPKYRWNLENSRASSTLAALWADWRIRHAHQAPLRRQAVLERAQAIADGHAKRLDVTAKHLVIDSGLLPRLWETGVLGGRTFDVLLTRPPLKLVHEMLDAEVARFPDRKNLADFRAPQKWVEMEWEALSKAQKIVTPHAFLAEYFGNRACHLEWSLPSGQPRRGGDHVEFLGPTVARQGCYEVRESAKRLGIGIRYVGNQFEGLDFWDGVEAKPASNDWLADAAVVVAPSLLESQPRGLLRAVAAGIPVITTVGSGLAESALVKHVPFGDVESLARALEGFGRQGSG